MILYTKRLVFIHIPKCAGSSIENAFNHIDDYQRYDSALFGPDHRPLRAIEQGDIRLRDVLSSYENITEFRRRLRARYKKKPNPMKNLQLTAEQYAAFYKFSFVRNPWDRVFSMYRHVMREEHKRKRYQVDKLKDTSFKTFLQAYIGKKDLMPQTYWLKNFKGELALDYIGRFENLLGDFEAICSAMAIPTPELPHIYKSEKGDYRVHYDTQMTEAVARCYHEEIALFGYQFE